MSKAVTATIRLKGPDPDAQVCRNKDLALKLAAHETPVTMSQIRKELGLRGKVTIDNFLRGCRHIPWITIERCEQETFRFHIDAELREICELRRPRPQLGGRSIAAFLVDLRGEITRRRKENNAKREQRRWNVEAILKVELVNLLDWIESELDKINLG
jgi:hypothetical protein